MAKKTEMVGCPRCSGTGIYTGYGVCFRCKGRKVVRATAEPAPQPVRVRGSAREEWERSVANLGEADAALIRIRNIYGSYTAEEQEIAYEAAERLGLL